MDAGSSIFLTSAAGAELLAAARAARTLPLHRRAATLQGRAEPWQVRAALAQDDIRRRALERCPHAEHLLFTAEALEQATAWPVAEERATRWEAPDDVGLVDLGAGIGLDALAVARTGRAVLAYERDPVRARLLAFNARALGLAERLEVRCEDVLRVAPCGPLAFFDPDRRAGGTRTRDPAAFDPPFEAWPALLGRFERAIVKLPPVVEGDAVMQGPQEVVSLGGRARERRLFHGVWSERPPRRALALPSGRSVEGLGAAWPAVRAVEPGDWLFDPDVSVTLAGLVGDLARRDGLLASHPEIPYLLAAVPSERAPGHWMQVDAVLPPAPKKINAWLAARGAGDLTIRKRGIEEKAAAWRKRLKPKGKAAATLVFTRDLRERWVVYGCVP